VKSLGILRCAQDDGKDKSKNNRQRQGNCEGKGNRYGKATAKANAGFFHIRLAQGQNDKRKWDNVRGGLG